MIHHTAMTDNIITTAHVMQGIHVFCEDKTNSDKTKSVFWISYINITLTKLLIANVENIYACTKSE